MRKANVRRVLRRETLRTLAKTSLERIVGGMATTDGETSKISQGCSSLVAISAQGRV